MGSDWNVRFYNIAPMRRCSGESICSNAAAGNNAYARTAGCSAALVNAMANEVGNPCDPGFYAGKNAPSTASGNDALVGCTAAETAGGHNARAGNFATSQ